jgi:hypothetical protein
MSTDDSENEKAQMTLRMTKRLYDLIRESAERNRRSANEHVLFLLETHPDLLKKIPKV